MREQPIDGPRQGLVINLRLLKIDTVESIDLQIEESGVGRGAHCMMIIILVDTHAVILNPRQRMKNPVRFSKQE